VSVSTNAYEISRKESDSSVVRSEAVIAMVLHAQNRVVWDDKGLILGMIANAGINVHIADSVIQCESSWVRTAINYNVNSVDKGYWQINSVHKLSDECSYDPICSTEFAISLIKKNGFNDWVCYR